METAHFSKMLTSAKQSTQCLIPEEHHCHCHKTSKPTLTVVVSPNLPLILECPFKILSLFWHYFNKFSFRIMCSFTSMVFMIVYVTFLSAAFASDN
jgi:hypothetical protein